MQSRDQLVRLQDALVGRDASDLLQGEERMAQVIEDAGAEHEIECANALRVQVVHVEPFILDLAVEMLAHSRPP